MNWTTIKTNLANFMAMNKMLMFAALFIGITVASAQTSSFNVSGLQGTLCNVISAVQEVIGVIAILLFVIGGVMYAVAHMMPSAGSLRANLQGWSMGMIVGGVVGLILVILAPGIVGFIVGNGLSTTANGQNAGLSAVSGCSGLGLFGGF